MKKLLALLAIGVAVKYFLDSNEGKQLKQHLSDLLGEAKNSMKDVVDTATPKMNA